MTFVCELEFFQFDLFSMKVSSFAFSVAAVSSTVIQLDTHPEGYLGISYNLVGGSGDLPGWAPLIYTLDPELERTSRVVPGEVDITTVDNQHIIAQSFLRRAAGEREPYIPIGFGSAFATLFGHYMLIPMHRQLVIAPANPGDFVQGGRLVTTASTSEDHPQVRVSVSLLNSSQEPGSLVPSASSIASTDIHEFSIVTAVPEDSIPASIIQALFDDLRRRQIRIHPGYGFDGTITSFDIIGDLSDEILDSLPIIQFRIHTDSGNDIIIQLDGRDYIGPLDGGIRELLYRAGDMHFFGSNTLSKIALYIDNRNRIGFGEPL